MLDDHQTKRAFVQCMQQQDCQSWLKGKSLIDTLLKSKPFLSQTIKYGIQDNFSRVRNVLMLVYIHTLNIDLPSYSYYKDRYQERFDAICSDRQSTYAQIFFWVMDKNGEERQKIIEFIIETLPLFLHKRMPYVSPSDLEIMVKIFNQMEVKTNHAMTLTMDFITILQKMTVGQLNKYDSKQNAIVMAVLSTLVDERPGKGNLGLLIDEYLMGKLEEQNIDSFCFIHSVFLSEIATHKLLKIFHELFQRGTNAYLLQLVNRLTNILKEGEEFFKLKQLYANFILPIVAKRAKSCTRQGVQKSALNLCQSYAIGFNEHCDIGQIGAECLLSNVQMVTSENYRKKWMELSLLTSKTKSTEQFILTLLQRKGIDENIINQCRKPSTNKEIWNITTRSIKQHKNYRKQLSMFIGISNKQFQCYIISVVQALFMTKRLPGLLSKTTKSHKCVQQLKYIFSDLDKKPRYRVKVDRLQRVGPKEFAISDQQQDAQQYLLALMNTLQEYFKQVRLQRQFKEIFEVSSQTAITCKACRHNTESKQSEYIHTISNKQKLSVSWEETIYDFTCAFCKKKQSTKRTSLSLNCHILIVHINRFSNIGGTIKKELPTQKILRKFGNYQLVGMIFHIGKMVQSGHYVFYAKIGKKRWVEFNDENTSEFDLDNQQQEFQKEFKAEKTPYILFYQRV